MGEVFFLLTRPLMGDPFLDPFLGSGGGGERGSGWKPPG